MVARRVRGGHQRVVVLNASFELLSVVGLHRAITYLLLDKAEMVADCQGMVLRSPSGFTIAVPSVVRLVRYVRVPYHHRVPHWSKAGLLRRDQHRCAYCGEKGTTVDHVMPVSRGGRSTWQNTVIACLRCNTRKGNRTPDEAHMRLQYRPHVPTMPSALLYALAAPERELLSTLGVPVPA